MKKQHRLKALLLLPVAALIIFSCNKGRDTISPEIKSPRKVELLAQKFTQPISSDYSKLVNEYGNLSETDLREFWLEIYKINSKNPSVQLTKENFLQLYEQLNSKSKSEFGAPMNKLTDKNLNNIFAGRENIASVVPPVEPPGDGCIFYLYPINLYEDTTLTASPPFYTYSIVDYFQGDCDGVEAVYSGTHWNRSKSITALGYMTGPVYPIGRHDGSSTKVLFKKSVMLMAFGSIANINNHKRLAYGFVGGGGEDE